MDEAQRGKAVQAAREKLEAELVVAMDSFEFWRAQPSVLMPGDDGAMYDLPSRRRDALHGDIVELQRALSILRRGNG